MANGKFGRLPVRVTATIEQISANKCEQGKREEKRPAAGRVGSDDPDLRHYVGIRPRRVRRICECRIEQQTSCCAVERELAHVHLGKAGGNAYGGAQEGKHAQKEDETLASRVSKPLLEAFSPLRVQPKEVGMSLQEAATPVACERIKHQAA